MKLDFLRDTIGYIPGAIAVMGKWETHMPPERCLLEVRARAAAAVGLAEAISTCAPAPYFLSAEAHLRNQPKPGCLMAADILMELGAAPGRIRALPAANRTVEELRALDRMRRELGAGGLVLVTSNYHVPRTRHILRREMPGVEQMEILSSTGSICSAALDLLDSSRGQRLRQAVQRGSREGLALLPMFLSEGIAFAGGIIPGLEARLANMLRGHIPPPPAEMLEPEPQPEPQPEP